MNILFTLNEQYLEPLQVLITSLTDQQPETAFHFHILYNELSFSASSRARLRLFIEELDQDLSWYPVEDCFREVPVSRYYSVEMYYRLIAPFLLPVSCTRVLYLDPDIVAVRPFESFYSQPFGDDLFVAASHNYASQWIQPINNLRLKTRTAKRYFNTGVILMNTERLRQESSMEAVFQAIEEMQNVLILPDQDIFNHLFYDRIREASWERYNVDPRVMDKLERVMPERALYERMKSKMVFIHYCGRHKPWKEREGYKYSLGEYYFRYEDLFLKERRSINERI